MLNVVLIAHLTYKNQWGEWHTKKTEFIRNDFDSLSIVALLEPKKKSTKATILLFMSPGNKLKNQNCH